MSVHLQREIDRLKNHVLSLCAIVEDQVQMAVRPCWSATKSCA